jgi:CheY-like chemotaxis protein
MLKALVVDDEAPARSELRYLLAECGGVEVVGEASNAVEALQLIKAIPYDVIFLDIQMSGLTGVQLAEVLAGLTNPPSIIFVTAHSEHAVKAFEVKAADYLVKPVELDRLKQAISRVEPIAEQSPARVERIPVEKAGKKLLVNVEDILYVMPRTITAICTQLPTATCRRFRLRCSRPSSIRSASSEFTVATWSTCRASERSCRCTGAPSCSRSPTTPLRRFRCRGVACPRSRRHSGCRRDRGAPTQGHHACRAHLGYARLA